MKKNELTNVYSLPPGLQVSARKMAEDELRLESSEVTADMISVRANEYLYRDTPEALLREQKPKPAAPPAPALVPAKVDAGERVTLSGGPVDTSERIRQVPLNTLMPSPFNPRGVLNPDEMKQFAAAMKLVEALRKEGKALDPARAKFSPRVESLLEMALTMMSPAGILQPLVVRVAKGANAPIAHEIVAGHRRWWSAQMAGLASAPVLVREVSDDMMVELMLIENLQREDLNPLEEARGIDATLLLRDEKGATKWTVETLAGKIGRSAQHILNTRRLLRVPAKFHGKIEDGTLGRSVCYLIAAVPDPKLREKCASEIVRGFGEGSFTARQAKGHIRRGYMVELRGSPFDQKDANLVAVREEDGLRCFGGACDTCPLNSANRKQDADSDDDGNIPMCMNPTCYQAKVDAYVKGALRWAEAQGDKVVTGDAAQKLLDWDGNVAGGTGLVVLSTKPTGELVGGKKAPSWEKMLNAAVPKTVTTSKGKDGQDVSTKSESAVRVQVTTIVDKKGKVLRVVDRSQAITAAKANGFGDLFVAGAEKKKGKVLTADAEAMKRRRAKELEEQKLESATASAWMTAVVEHVAGKGLREEAWLVLLQVAIGHAGSDGRKWVINRRGLEMVKTKTKYQGEQPDAEKTLQKHADNLTPKEITSLVVELMLAQGVRWHGSQNKDFNALLEACEIPTKEIQDHMKAELAEKKKPKSAKASAEPEPVRGKILALAKKQKLSDVGLQMVASRLLGKPFKESPFAAAIGSELTCILDEMTALSKLDAKKGWIQAGEKLKCPRCGGLVPGVATKIPAMSCAPACGYEGKLPAVKVVASLGEIVKDHQSGKVAPLKGKELKELNALSGQMEALRKSLSLSFVEVMEIAEKTLGRRHLNHGGKDNFWHKSDYLATIAELKARAKNAKKGPRVGFAKICAVENVRICGGGPAARPIGD